MHNRRNYYRILQVQPGAPVEIIRASYRTLMQRLKAHPDLGGDHGNAALINEAYAVLTDPAKRAEYDREFQARVEDTRTAAGQASAESVAESSGHCLFCGAQHRSSPTAKVNAVCATCGSPLHRATLKRLTAAGRRAIERLPRRHSLTLYTSWPQPQGIAGESRDVSLQRDQLRHGRTNPAGDDRQTRQPALQSRPAGDQRPRRARWRKGVLAHRRGIPERGLRAFPRRTGLGKSLSCRGIPG